MTEQKAPEFYHLSTDKRRLSGQNLGRQGKFTRCSGQHRALSYLRLMPATPRKIRLFGWTPGVGVKTKVRRPDRGGHFRIQMLFHGQAVTAHREAEFDYVPEAVCLDRKSVV